MKSTKCGVHLSVLIRTQVDLFVLGQTLDSRCASLFHDSDSQGLCSFAALESKMKILAKSRMAMLLVMVAASGALFAQSSGPDKPQSHASVLDARQIVGQSVAATERSWQARDHYAYTARDEERRLDLLGHVKSEKIAVARMMLVIGAVFGQQVVRHGECALDRGQASSPA